MVQIRYQAHTDGLKVYKTTAIRSFSEAAPDGNGFFPQRMGNVAVHVASGETVQLPLTCDEFSRIYDRAEETGRTLNLVENNLTAVQDVLYCRGDFSRVFVPPKP